MVYLLKQLTQKRENLLEPHSYLSKLTVISCVTLLVYFAVEEVAVRFRCPCCGCRTLEAPNAMGLCPVCWWEDDGQEDADAAEVRLTVNGQLSLSDARGFYLKIGAAHPRFLPYVRKPQLTER